MVGAIKCSKYHDYCKYTLIISLNSLLVFISEKFISTGEKVMCLELDNKIN